MKLRTAIVMALASPFYFGTVATAQELDGDKGGSADKSLEEIVITGSRIQRDGYSAPTPLTVANTEEMLKITPTNIPDSLNKLPQFQLSSSPARSTHNFADTAVHGNILNLRGVGGNRTLILMDGLRVPPTTFRGNVDVNVIPNLLIDRVEIVTGGASAVYGSDAVAGVVNFVLDKDFTGIKGVAQSGLSAQGDNEHSRLGLAGGFEFAEGNGHALFSVEHFESDGMLRSERAAGAEGWIYAGANPDCLGVPGSACAPGGPDNPYKLYPDGRLTVGQDYGLINSGAFAGYRILPTGDLTPFDRGTRTGSSIFASGGDGYTIPYDVSTVAPLDTDQVFGRLEYDLDSGMTAYAQGIFSQTRLNYSSLSNSWTGLTNAPIHSGNPYLPAELQASMGPNDVISVGNYDGPSPNPEAQEEGEFWMASFGLEGDLGDFRWKAEYSHGQNEHSVDQSGLYNWQRAYAAVDAVRDGSGNIVCRASLSSDPTIASRFSDCKPINVLGVSPQTATPEGYAYATGTSSYKAENQQDIFAFSISGPAFELPAGSVDFAVGAEYREEELTLDSNANPALLDTAEEKAEHFAGLRGVHPSALFYWLQNVGIADGSSDVLEAFIETNVPLLSGVTGAERLDLNLAYRRTDYSTSGEVDTWKVGMQWQPVQDVVVRGTMSRDIRAPSLYDLFAGRSSAISNFFDPVTGQQGNIQSVLGGNPNLQPEESDTVTYGIVVTPSAVEGLSFSIDYYSLEVDQAIGSLNGQQIIDNCFALGGPECDLITRPAPDQFPSEILQAQANIAYLETAGIDFDVTYTTDAVGPGQLTTRLYANKLLTYETQQYAGAPVVDFVGIAEADTIPEGRPEWSGMLNVSYQMGNFGINVSEQYIGDMEVGLPGSPANFVDGNVDAVWYTDLTTSYNFETSSGSFEVFLTINNLFDKDFPLIPSTIPGANLPTVISVYDTVGRAFTLGTRFQF